MNKYRDLWVNKYSPKTIQDIVLSKDNRNFFSKINDDTPHMLFHGSPGIGKTALSKILVNDVLKCQYLYINASDENGVDTIRNKVISFSQTSSFDGKKKVIILDEADGLSVDSQRILRNVMEEYASTTRFILTANYINRIIEPLCSRCLLFNVLPELDDVIKRVCFILKSENVKVEDNQKEKLLTYIENNFPDMRRIINDLQMFSITGSLVINGTDKVKNFAQTVFDNLIKKTSDVEIRKLIIESEKTFGSNYQSLMRELFELFFLTDLVKDEKKKSVLLEIGEHMYRDNLVIDHEINMFCLILNIKKTL